jgi:glycosyltransferase involved in cell wall biosynthesis
VTLTPVYSIVVPVFNEQETLPELFGRLMSLLERLDGPAEVVLVDDGSRDESYALVLEMNARDDRFKALQLSRNFGHQVAITAGLDVAIGGAVVVMDADLQDPPETMLEMAKCWREGFDVVYGVRRERPGESRFKRASAAAFYRLLQRFADVELPNDVGDFRLMDRKAVDAYLAMRESDRYVRGMISWVGFNQVGVPYDRDQRAAGNTKFPLRTMLKFAADGIVSFSNAPLRFALILGCLVSLASFVYACVAIFLKASGATVPGWTSLILVTTFLGGMQLIVLGVIGEYVGRAYLETKRRPLYVVKGAVGFGTAPRSPDRTAGWPLAPSRGRDQELP